MNDLQINTINRTIGQLMLRVGIMKLRDAQSDFISVSSDNIKLIKAITQLGIDVVPLDDNFWFTSWDNWRKIIDVLNPIAQQFNWEAERFDCDNRANLMTALTSLIFRVNSCTGLYCDVYDAKTGAYKYRHYANLIVDIDDNVYLWDVDQGGLTQKITTKEVVMGVNKYILLNARAY